MCITFQMSLVFLIEILFFMKYKMQIYSGHKADGSSHDLFPAYNKIKIKAKH